MKKNSTTLNIWERLQALVTVVAAKLSTVSKGPAGVEDVRPQSTNYSISIKLYSYTKLILMNNNNDSSTAT